MVNGGSSGKGGADEEGVVVKGREMREVGVKCH